MINEYLTNIETGFEDQFSHISSERQQEKARLDEAEEVVKLMNHCW
jgi:hypothetical protein